MDVTLPYREYLLSLSPDDLWVEMQRITSLSRQDWLDLLTLPTAQMQSVLTTYSHLEWTQPGTSAFDKTLAILSVIGTVAGVVSGVAGAVVGVQTIAALLRG